MWTYTKKSVTEAIDWDQEATKGWPNINLEQRNYDSKEFIGDDQQAAQPRRQSIRQSKSSKGDKASATTIS